MVIHTWGFVDTRPGSPWTKSWDECVARHFHSKRLRAHLSTLSEGHARWRNANFVSTRDVRAAFEVMWMNRPGWRLE